MGGEPDPDNYAPWDEPRAAPTGPRAGGAAAPRPASFGSGGGAAAPFRSRGRFEEHDDRVAAGEADGGGGSFGAGGRGGRWGGERRGGGRSGGDRWSGHDDRDQAPDRFDGADESYGRPVRGGGMQEHGGFGARGRGGQGFGERGSARFEPYGRPQGGHGGSDRYATGAGRDRSRSRSPPGRWSHDKFAEVEGVAAGTGAEAAAAGARPQNGGGGAGADAAGPDGAMEGGDAEQLLLHEDVDIADFEGVEAVEAEAEDQEHGPEQGGAEEPQQLLD